MEYRGYQSKLKAGISHQKFTVNEISNFLPNLRNRDTDYHPTHTARKIHFCCNILQANRRTEERFSSKWRFERLLTIESGNTPKTFTAADESRFLSCFALAAAVIFHRNCGFWARDWNVCDETRTRHTNQLTVEICGRFCAPFECSVCWHLFGMLIRE